MSVTADISATAVTSSSATTRGSPAFALSPCFAGKFVSTISNFMPSERPCAFPPSRYTTPSATYFTLNTVCRFGSSMRPITVDVSVRAGNAVAAADGADDNTGAAGSLLGLAGAVAASEATEFDVDVEAGVGVLALTPEFALPAIWTVKAPGFGATSGDDAAGKVGEAVVGCVGTDAVAGGASAGGSNAGLGTAGGGAGVCGISVGASLTGFGSCRLRKTAIRLPVVAATGAPRVARELSAGAIVTRMRFPSAVTV